MDRLLEAYDGDYDVSLYHHSDDALWPLIGRAFADNRIRRELGAPMASDENHHWLVVTKGRELTAFGGAKVRGNTAALRHAYVYPAHRGRGVFAAMLARGLDLLDEHGVTRISTCCTPMSRDAHLAAGFIETGRRGQYHLMGYDRILASGIAAINHREVAARALPL